MKYTILFLIGLLILINSACGDNDSEVKTEEKNIINNTKSNETKKSLEENSHYIYEKVREKLLMTGKETYMYCMACHGPDGKGIQVGEKKMATTLHNSKYVNGDPSIFALIILKGIKKDGDKFLNTMNSLEAVLDDEKLASVMSYVRNSFSNKSHIVTKEEVAGYRDKWKDIKNSLSYAEIDKLAKKDKEPTSSDKEIKSE